MDRVLFFEIMSLITAINFGLWRKSFLAGGVMWGILSLALEFFKKVSHG